MLILTGALVATVVALALVFVAGSVGVAAARARTAADATALAAMAESPLAGGGGAPERAAARVAAENGGPLVAVDLDDWPLGIAVEVAAQPLLPVVRARAAAAVRPPHPTSTGQPHPLDQYKGGATIIR